MRKYRFVILSMLVLSVFIYSGNGQVWAKDPQIVLAADGAGKAPRSLERWKSCSFPSWPRNMWKVF